MQVGCPRTEHVNKHSLQLGYNTAYRVMVYFDIKLTTAFRLRALHSYLIVVN
jgi:hypothetical protein